MALSVFLLSYLCLLGTGVSARKTGGGSLAFLHDGQQVLSDLDDSREVGVGSQIEGGTQGIAFTQLRQGGSESNDEEEGDGLRDDYENADEGGWEGGSGGAGEGDESEMSGDNDGEASHQAESENEEGLSERPAPAFHAAMPVSQMLAVKLAADSPRVGYVDGQEACSALGCPRVTAGAGPRNPITGCAKGVKCGGCQGRLDAESRCQAWKTPSRPDVILATGWHFTKHTISRSGAFEIDLNWDTDRDLDFSKCMPDLRQVTKSFKELQETGNVKPFTFHRMVNVQLAVHRLPSEGMEDEAPKKMSFSIQFTDPHTSALVAPGGSAQRKPMCSGTDVTIPITTLGRKTAMYGVGWLSIPKDQMFPITTRNFVVRMQCSGVQACNLNRIGVCARITCPATAAVAEQQMASVQNAMSKPVGEGPVEDGATAAPQAVGGAVPRVFQAATGRFGSHGPPQSPLVLARAPYPGVLRPGYPFFIMGHAAVHAPSVFWLALIGFLSSIVSLLVL
ncbi:hypothetical protein BESB_061140 [Besnoitia besnoiti]|uniref:Transmembrane protein n=1 Tax=Besnoitia besnoiti TaxID=94643 RepID=A0A2A9MI10_BESBE|nr:hypothetical protein BESB_061140 [Besnoitia besnoiti]PFH35227.1 hypothetical protein BESB_061140 [Besnoitia besnoiti]